MSYILEALKKSQHERELGQAPTLVAPNFPSEEKRARPNLWILVALILATSAVVIALYSALRGGPPVATVAQTAQTATRETRDRDPATPKQPMTKPLPRQAPLRPPGPVASGPRGSANRFPAHTPVAPETTASSVAMGAPAPFMPPPPPQRQGHKKGPVAEGPPMAPTQERDGKIPPDLIADIEAFKREVREGQAGMTEAPRVEEKTAPRDLRLPKAVRNRLPEFVMSAHIYDSEPSRRFVLINGLKIGEGEVSREGIAVERILPDGAVLSFEGHRFFRRR